MKAQRVLPLALLVSGIVAVLFGLALVAAHILEAVVDRLGESDQSLLFWYLPILCVGLISADLGIVRSAWGIYRMRKGRKG